MRNKFFTYGQAMILVFGIIAISWAVGSEVGVVSGVMINGKNYEYGQQVEVTIGSYTQKGYLTRVDDNKNWAYALSKTKNEKDYIDFKTGEKDSGNAFFNAENIKSISLFNPFQETTQTQSPATNPASNSKKTFEGGYQYDAGDTYIDPTTGETKYKEINPYVYEAGTGENNGGTTSNEVDKNDYLEYQKSRQQTPSTETDWSWYDHLFGTSGKNTRIYNDKKYYYEADEGGTRTWFRTEGGTQTKASDADATALNAGQGTQPKDFGLESAGKTFLAGVALAQTAKVGVNAIAKAVGTTDEQAKALSEGVEMGIYAGTITDSIMELTGRSGGSAGTWVAGAVALWYILNTYKDVDEKSVTFECSVWEAPKGGTNCEKCNNAIFGCSEYQCKSLGRGCKLLNPGTEEELCAWVNRKDAQEPKIEAWRDALSEEYQYTPDTAQSPPDRGVIIKLKTDAGNQQSCIPAYTRLEFGVQLDEPATCKIDTERKASYEEMDYYFGSSSLARYNHPHTMSLPSITATGTVIQSGGNMSLYVRCEDANGNSNTGEFVFKFCVEPEEDFTAPLITETDPTNNNPVAYNISKINLTAYVNERAKCKWDFTDTSYELMNTTFTCSNTHQVRSAQTVFPCTTTLTGIKDRAENNYYIRCNDSNGNINKESHDLTLIGTQPLYIDFAKPNSTIVRGATSPVQVNFEVKTSSGADDGNAYCYYKPIDALSYVQFLYDPIEMTYQHTQQLSLSDGAYAYSIKCVDAGGNSVFKDIEFDVKIDTGSPVVVRAYKEDGYLKLITDEESECVYNTQKDIGCGYEYEVGIEMQTVDEDEHFVEWNSQETFYIKCKDTFDNPPLYSDCSIIARPSEGQTL